MPSSIHARHSGSARILSHVARVSADSGLIVALPHNLYQIARRTLPVDVGPQPGASNSAEQARDALAASRRSGSPMISLSACLTITAVVGAAARGMDDAADDLLERQRRRDAPVRDRPNSAAFPRRTTKARR